MQDYARTHLAIAVKRQRWQYHRDKNYFQPGTKVWLFTLLVKSGVSKKLTSYWTGPWRVCTEPAKYKTMVRITPDPSWKGGSKRGMHVVSIDRLWLYHGKEVRATSPDLDMEMSGDEFAETRKQNRQHLGG